MCVFQYCYAVCMLCLYLGQYISISVVTSTVSSALLGLFHTSCYIYLCLADSQSGGCTPANTGHSPNVVSMLGQRRRRWANIETTLGEFSMFAGLVVCGVLIVIMSIVIMSTNIFAHSLSL